MILFHSHKRGIGIGLAIAAPLIPDYLFLLTILVQGFRPFTARIIQLLPDFAIYFLVFEYVIYLFDRLPDLPQSILSKPDGSVSSSSDAATL